MHCFVYTFDFTMADSDFAVRLSIYRIQEAIRDHEATILADDASADVTFESTLSVLNSTQRRSLFLSTFACH